MIRTQRAFLAVLTALLFLHAAAQPSEKLPGTFLWRITGNGLARPSYLFGSMHVKDRRAFQFSDSLYHFLETTDGYAMEIDPEEAMAAVFKTIGDPDNSPLLKDEMNPDDFKKLSRDLEKRYGVPADRITKKQAWLYQKSYEEVLKKKPDDMDAVIDLYLYQVAKQSGKQVGGIEDVEDQLNLIESMKTSYNAGDVLENKMKSGNAMDKLLQIYIAQNLTGVNETVNEMPAGERDTLLLKRNHKMARRMDSLAHLRSEFFTVGVAHLPGAEGVLRLLQARGFTVTPVFSKTTIAPEKYAYAKKELPWQTVADNNKTYAVEMPGKPSSISPDGMNAMQIYADLGTGLLYFVAAYPVGTTKNTDSLLKATGKRFMATSRLHGAPQPVVYNGLKGLEVLKDSAQYTYRLRLLPNGNQLVLVMMGSEKPARLYGEEAQRFYNSLRLSAPKVAETVPKEAWHRYTNARWAVQVAFPDTPQSNAVMQKAIEKRDVTHSWNYFNQTALDAVNNAYYMLIIKETQAGRYISDENRLFEESKTNFENAGEVILTRYDTGRWQGLPAAWLEGNYKNQNLRLKSLTVARGNRLYALMAIYDKGGDSTNADFYLHTLHLPEPQKATWQNYTDPLNRFATQAPQPFFLDADSTAQTSQTLVAYDSLSARSYEVQIDPMPAYFWATNDSTLYESLLQPYRAEGDSLLQAKALTAGAAHGKEFEIRTANGRTIKRLRFFPNGDSMYLLYTVAPECYTNSAEADAFFNNFHFINYHQPTGLFNDHTEVLLQQLQAKDSATFARAKAYIEKAPFTAADVPQLHRAMLQLYPDWDSTYSEAQNQLFGKAIELDSEATIHFIEQNYATLTGDREPLKYRMLIGLATIKTSEAYGLLKKLMVTALPKSGSSGGLATALRDSPALAQTLFPEVLVQAGDTLLYDQLVRITNNLLDSNLLQPTTIAPYSSLLVANAKRLWQKTAMNENEVWQLYQPIKLLGVLNTNGGNALLQEIAKAKYVGLKEAAIMALLRNNQPVAAATILPVAADRYNRITLYEDLKKLGKLSLFPAAYRNQKSLAESVLYQSASEDYDPSKMTFTGTRTASYKGSKKLFYLWKIQYEGDEAAYLGVCGPYDGTTAPLNSSPDISQVLSEPFDTSKVDAQLTKFLKAQESDD